MGSGIGSAAPATLTLGEHAGLVGRRRILGESQARCQRSHAVKGIFSRLPFLGGEPAF
jgi:hypothetical protein